MPPASINFQVPIHEPKPAKPASNRTNTILFIIIAFLGLFLTIPVIMFVPKSLEKAGIIHKKPKPTATVSPSPVESPGLAVNESPKPEAAPTGAGSDQIKKGNDLIADKNYEGALSAFEEALKSDPDSSQAYDGIGYCLFKLGKTEESIEKLNKSIELNPKNWIAYLDRGDAYKKLGKNKDALTDYGTVVENSDRYRADAHNSRGIIYMGSKDYDRAFAEFNRAISENPKYYQAYNNRGFCRSQNKSYDDAISDYNEAIRLNPDFMLAYSNRGFAYYNNHNYKKAVSDFSKAIELDPMDADSYNGRGISFQALNSYERAFPDFNKAIEIDPGFSGAYLNRGIAYYEKEDNDNAISDYSKAIELNPTNPRTYFNRGLAYYKKGDKSSAGSDWQKAVDLDKDGDTGKRALKKLQELEEKTP
jgi:tetratricopeptide (TPR) repeat protein